MLPLVSPNDCHIVSGRKLTMEVLAGGEGSSVRTVTDELCDNFVLEVTQGREGHDKDAKRRYMMTQTGATHHC